MGDNVESFTAELVAEPKNFAVNIENGFGEVETLGVGSIVKEIKLMVVSKSGAIARKLELTR